MEVLFDQNLELLFSTSSSDMILCHALHPTLASGLKMVPE
jgi:hypothetical protein